MKYCEVEGCEANTGFAMKASLKENPYASLLFAFVASALVLGVSVTNFEGPLNEYLILDPGSQQNFTLWNGMWLVIITMTTVGFGDFYCRSHVARFCSVLSIFWGTFLTSLMVVTLTNSMTLDTKEAKAFSVLYKMKAKKNIKDKATFIVTLLIRARCLYEDVSRRKKGFDPSKPTDLEKIEALEKNYDEEKAEIYSRLDTFKTMFNEATSDLQSVEEDPVEEIRTLSLLIEKDFTEMKNFFIAIRELEANMSSIYKSQELVAKMVEGCKQYNEMFAQELETYKGGLFSIGKLKEKDRGKDKKKTTMGPSGPSVGTSQALINK